MISLLQALHKLYNNLEKKDLIVTYYTNVILNTNFGFSRKKPIVIKRFNVKY